MSMLLVLLSLSLLLSSENETDSLSLSSSSSSPLPPPSLWWLLPSSLVSVPVPTTSQSSLPISSCLFRHTFGTSITSSSYLGSSLTHSGLMLVSSTLLPLAIGSPSNMQRILFCFNGLRPPLARNGTALAPAIWLS
uniref:Secreted protein n=1 Tax=Arundo donax TaxID=35708 RepID=A0A0A8YCW2_ARUDO